MNRIALALIATLPLAFAAHADEADGSQLPISFKSTRTTEEVRAEAQMPWKIGNGSTGFIGVTKSATTREEVSRQAEMAVREGKISKGEI